MKSKLEKINFNNYKPLGEVIFDTLREAIVVGELKPGERLMEVSLASKMGVSRTPVREAIRKLELDGLVRMIPRKGAHVAELSIKNIIDVLEVRAALDSLATSLAAKRITEEETNELRHTQEQFESYVKKNNVNGSIKKDVEFHDIIYKSSRNEKLIQISNNLREQIHRYRIIYLKDFSGHKELIKEHYNILNAVVKKDVDAAGGASSAHINKQQKDIINAIKNHEIK